MPIVTGPCIASYPTLFVPRINKEKLKKNPNVLKDFGISGLFTKEQFDSPIVVKLRSELQKACEEQWGKDAFATLVAEDSFDSPFRKDISSKGYPPNIHRYISCSSNEEHPPGVYGTELDPDSPPDKPRPKRLTDPRAIYAGAVIQIGVSIRCYGGPGTKWKAGAKFDLRSVQKLGDGPRLVDNGDGDGEGLTVAAAAPAAEMGSLLD